MKAPTDHFASDIQQRIEPWLRSSSVEARWKSELLSLQIENPKELEQRFASDLSFGTAGMRAVVGVGSARLNTPNVRRLAYGLAQYLKTTNATPRVVIAYDSRLSSQEFAEAAAQTLLSQSVEVWMPKEPQPVPTLSFAIRAYRAGAGLAITASHNPPEYNGCKIYGADGGQICAPADTALLEYIPAWQDWFALAEALPKISLDKVHSPSDWVSDYVEALAKYSVSDAGKSTYSLIYTPLHGSAGKVLARGLKRFGFKSVQGVPEQLLPDGHFPTVRSPNPEEPSAYEMAKALAEKTGANAILATDPDGDRVGTVVRDHNGFHFMPGNTLLCLLSDFYLRQLKESGRLPKPALLITSVVTSPLHRRIGEAFGAEVRESLTGFKWMAKILREPHPAFLVAGEEAHGVLVGDSMRDKDGVLGACLVAEMLAHYHEKGFSYADMENYLFERYGTYYNTSASIPASNAKAFDAPTSAALLDRLEQAVPTQIQSRIVRFRNFIREPLAGFPEHPLGQWHLADGTRLSVRPSGTEPKLKIYLTTCDTPGGRPSPETYQDCVVRADTYLSILRNMILEVTQ